MQECFPEYALIFDGSSFGDETECVMVQLVHKMTWKIRRFVICIGLFDHSLNGQTTCDNTDQLVNGNLDNPDDTRFELRLNKCLAAAID